MGESMYFKKKSSSLPASTPASKSVSWRRPFPEQSAYVQPQSDDKVDEQAQSDDRADEQAYRRRLSSNAMSRLDSSLDLLYATKPIQPKLTVGAPGDKYEQEADRVADQVMSMGDRLQPVQREAAPEEEEVQTKAIAASITPLVQREMAPEEEEVQPKLAADSIQREEMLEEEGVQTNPLSNIQREEMPEEEEPVQMKPSLQRSSDGSLQAGGNIESQLSSSKGGGSALPDEVRSFMESRFGADFSQVRVHTDSAAIQMNQNLNAQAFTHGSDIYFGAGKSPAVSDLTAHELTHVVQQTGNQKTTIQRFEVEGPFDIKSPVHETLTQEALRKAGMIEKKNSYKSRGAWEYIRGAFWNDDPQGQFFDDSVTNPKNNNYSSGVEWLRNFNKAEKQAEGGKQFGSNDSLLERSHFGDLQFIHGMASADGEDAKVTLSNIMMWAEFTYKVAIGNISGTKKIGEVDISGFPEHFPKQKEQTVSQFFGILVSGDVKQRATGSLLHMIQDSYASGHVEREVQADESKGAIKSFHSYAHQDHSKHGASDEFGKGFSVQEKIKKTPGAQDAIYVGTEVLKFIKDNEPWDTVKDYLEVDVFNLAARSEKAGPGESYKRMF
jgi:Domain of unknown function (DUF4157)